MDLFTQPPTPNETRHSLEQWCKKRKVPLELLDIENPRQRAKAIEDALNKNNPARKRFAGKRAAR